MSSHAALDTDLLLSEISTNPPLVFCCVLSLYSPFTLIKGEKQ